MWNLARAEAFSMPRWREEMLTAGGEAGVPGHPQVLELIWLRDNADGRQEALGRMEEEAGLDRLAPRPKDNCNSRLFPMQVSSAAWLKIPKVTTIEVGDLLHKLTVTAFQSTQIFL